ncbi:MAG: hypothetical protein HY951_05080 [Bacteroidia bacterium]|nr:hypothetical protein [Bacteroidia bacterium]
MKKIILLCLYIGLIFSVNVAFSQKKGKKDKTKSTTTTNSTNTPANTIQQNNPVIVNETLKTDNNITEVEVKGVGIKRDDALQDALRNAVGQGAGVAIVSETNVENFMVVRDAISSKTEGYIASYVVLKEIPFPDRYEVTIKAKVSLSPLKADIQTLSKSIGGVRFLVMYDTRKVSAEEKPFYDFACERVNEFLAERKYRYIDKGRFETLQKEAIGLYQDETNSETYVQRLGMKADAQFIILISNISLSSTEENYRSVTKVMIEAKAYDNCTAEGLGTIVLEADAKYGEDPKSTKMLGVKDAVNNGFIKLLYLFNQYIGNWVNNGTPYEIRFYSIGTFRDFRELRNKMLADSKFGGQLEIVSLENFTKLNLTFKDRPDDLAYKILDYADQIPEFKSKILDVKLIYGRQINYAPQKVKVPELEQVKSNIK